MQIDLHEIKRNHDLRGNEAPRKALELALKEKRDEKPVSKIRASKVSKKHSTRTGGIRLSLKKFSGFGEITHRAIKSTTFSASDLLEKYDELMEVYEDKKERHQKQKERKREKKSKAEDIFEQMALIAEDFDGLEAKFGRIRENRFGEEEIRIKANSNHRGVKLSLKDLTVEQFEQILSILS